MAGSCVAEMASIPRRSIVRRDRPLCSPDQRRSAATASPIFGPVVMIARLEQALGIEEGERGDS
jgi:hypothetical protein